MLVDTCVGNDKRREGSPAWHMRRGTYLEDLAAAGVEPEDVHLVVCTHLHVDHVGWNTRLVDGHWVATFPRARYLIVGEEWELWRHERDRDTEPSGCIDDSVVPIVGPGCAVLVEADRVIDEHLRFEPWPGHTPGHACVRLRTSAGEAVFAGDLIRELGSRRRSGRGKSIGSRGDPRSARVPTWACQGKPVVLASVSPSLTSSPSLPLRQPPLRPGTEAFLGVVALADRHEQGVRDPMR